MTCHTFFTSRWRRFILALFATATLIGFGSHYYQTGINAISRPPSSDFHKFYLSAQRLRAGLSMYWLVPPRDRRGDACHPDTPDEERAATMPLAGRLTLGGELPCLGPNLNPPVFMALMQPLSQLPYAQAWWIWAAFSSICAVIGVWLMTNQPGRTLLDRLFLTLLGSTALFSFYPTLANFSLGQMGTALLPLLTLTWIELHRHRFGPAGTWLGLAIALKPFLGFMLLGLLALQQWKAIVIALLTILMLSAFGAMLYGISAYQDYALVANNVHWTATNWNGSWFGFIDRAFISQADLDWPTMRPLSKTLGTICAMATLATLLWRLRHMPRQGSSDGIDALFALGLPVTLLASPLGWMYYFPALALSVFIAWQHTNRHSARRTMRWALLLPVTMSLVPITLQPSPSPLNPAQWWGIDAWYFYALIALAGAALASLHSKSVAT